MLGRRGLSTIEVEPGVVAIVADGKEVERLPRRGLRRFVEFHADRLPTVPAIATEDNCGDLPLDALMGTSDMV